MRSFPFPLVSGTISTMTEPPISIPGQVIATSPAIPHTAIIDPISMATHRFCNLMRAIVTNQHGILKSESEVDDAIHVIDAFERHLIPQRDRSLIGSPDDMAPKEDVSQRIPPRSSTPPPMPAAGPSIDYNALAQAILLAQSQRDEPPPAPEMSDDEPAGDDSTN